MIWVICEQGSGEITPASYGALGAGRLLAGRYNRALNAAIAGHGIDGAAAALTRYADEVCYIEHRLLARPAAYGCKKVFGDILRDKGAKAVVVAATSFGAELAPLLAVSLGAECVANVTAIEVNGGAIRVSRPLYGGSVVERLRVENCAIISVMPRAFSAPPPRQSPGRVIKTTAELNEADLKVRVIEVLKPPELKDLTGADVIVAGGRGMASRENFAILDELAALLGGMTAASRGAVDSGWMDQSRQVGQTGKTVSPKLYIACGISGAPQHLAGMRNSGFVVAINKDPGAPIAREADLFLTADLFEAVPLLIKEIKALKGI